MHVYESFYAHLQDYYSRRSSVSYNHVSVKRYMYNQAQLCNHLFQHNVTNDLFELQMCLTEKLILISLLLMIVSLTLHF